MVSRADSLEIMPLAAVFIGVPPGPIHVVDHVEVAADAGEVVYYS